MSHTITSAKLKGTSLKSNKHQTKYLSKDRADFVVPAVQEYGHNPIGGAKTKEDFQVRIKKSFSTMRAENRIESNKSVKNAYYSRDLI